MIEGLGCIVITGGILKLIGWLLTSKEQRQQDCDDKIAYDWEYDMWFEGHPHHECKLCKPEVGE